MRGWYPRRVTVSPLGHGGAWSLDHLRQRKNCAAEREQVEEDSRDVAKTSQHQTLEDSIELLTAERGIHQESFCCAGVGAVARKADGFGQAKGTERRRCASAAEAPWPSEIA